MLGDQEKSLKASDTCFALAEIKKATTRLEKRGFIELNELLGASWEGRCVGKDPYSLIEKSTGLVFADSVSFKEYKEDLPEESRKLLGDLNQVSDQIEIVTMHDNEQLFAFTSRKIMNSSGEVAFNLHELVDVSNPVVLQTKGATHDSGLVGFSAIDVIFSFDEEISGNGSSVYSTNYISTTNLSKNHNLAVDFIYYTSNGNVVNKNLESVLARLYGGASPSTGNLLITNFSGVVSYLHEMGHHVYSFTDEDWNILMDISRLNFKSKSKAEVPGRAEEMRKLVSFDERAAWDFVEKFLGWMQLQSGTNIGYLDMINKYKKEFAGLLSYDMSTHQGQDPNPVAFSDFMRELRRVAIQKGVRYRFAPDTGDPISHCPILQLVHEGHENDQEVVDIVERFFN